MPPIKRSERGLIRWLVTLIVVVVIVAVGAPFVYIHFIQGKAPAKLSLQTTPTVPTTPHSARAPLAGTWKVGTGSTAGYRVKETLVGQSNTAVGRTKSVTGSMTVAAARVTAATFTVDMTSVASVGNKIDSALIGQRDDQFRNRIMNTSQYPTAKFVLTTPINLAPVPKDDVQKSYSATGKLTLHGTTNIVTIPITARRTANVIQVQGDLALAFSDYGINNPSGGPASVGDTGQLEFLLQFTKASASPVAPN